VLVKAPSSFSPEAKRPAELRPGGGERVGIGRALVDNFSAAQTCAAIMSHARSGGRPSYVITPNAQHIVLLEKDESFCRIYKDASLVIADGVSLLFAARFFGRVLKERVAGVDLFVQLAGLAAEQGLRIFLLGGRPGSAELAGAILQSKYPSLQYQTFCPPMGFDADPAGLEAVAASIRAFQPHILFVGLGAPKQEQWIYEHALQLSVPVSLGIGGSFEMVGGVVRRAPVWVQKLGCEWLFRLLAEPRRMWRRYLIGNLEFAAIVAQQRLRRALLGACVRLASEGRFGAELEEYLTLDRAEPGQLFAAHETILEELRTLGQDCQPMTSSGTVTPEHSKAYDAYAIR